MTTNAQHNGTGIDSITSLEFSGSTRTGAISLIGSGAVMSGCVFDIFTVDFAGFGSGIIAMRAVSFLGPGAGIIAMRAVSFLGPGAGAKDGSGGGTAATGGAFGATGGGGGGGISGGSTMDSAMGGAWSGESSGSAIDGTGNEGGFSGCPNPGSTGARVVGNGGALGGFRVWEEADELLGARDGRLILIVSRGPLFELDALPA